MMQTEENLGVSRDGGFQDIYVGRDNISHGVRIGELLYVKALETSSRVGTQSNDDDIRTQTREVLERMNSVLESAGGSHANIGRAVGYLRSAGEQREALYDVWEELFPDPTDKPAFKVLDADLPPGILLQMDLVAVLGHRRTRFDIPGVDARDPTVRIGNLVFTSRLHGTSPETGTTVIGLQAQARQAVANGIRLVELAGGSQEDITQITAFGRDLAYVPALRAEIESQFGVKCPSLHPLVTFIRPQLEVMVEMTACI